MNLGVLQIGSNTIRYCFQDKKDSSIDAKQDHLRVLAYNEQKIVNKRKGTHICFITVVSITVTKFAPALAMTKNARLVVKEGAKQKMTFVTDNGKKKKKNEGAS